MSDRFFWGAVVVAGALLVGVAFWFFGWKALLLGLLQWGAMQEIKQPERKR